MDAEGTWKLKCSDEKIIEIEEKCFTQSKFLEDYIKDFPDKNIEIPLNEIKSATMEKIKEYLVHFKEGNPTIVQAPLASPDLKPLLSEWEYNYISPILLPDLADLVNGANFLNIKSLVNLCCARFASELINCPVEEAREKFGIECDMTEEEMDEYDRYPLD